MTLQDFYFQSEMFVQFSDLSIWFNIEFDPTMDSTDSQQCYDSLQRDAHLKNGGENAQIGCKSFSLNIQLLTYVCHNQRGQGHVEGIMYVHL